jgi:hypothetical protein
VELFRENQSEFVGENGTGLSSRCIHHANVRVFFFKDQIMAGEVEIQYCPSDQMIKDVAPKAYNEKSCYSSRRLSWVSLLNEPLKECVGLSNQRVIFILTLFVTYIQSLPNITSFSSGVQLAVDGVDVISRDGNKCRNIWFPTEITLDQ